MKQINDQLVYYQFYQKFLSSDYTVKYMITLIVYYKKYNVASGKTC